MKNFLIGVLSCLVAALAFGVEPVQRLVNETVNPGSVRGVENCLEYSRSELLADDIVREMCVRTFQRRLFNTDHATGRAGPRGGQSEAVWGGTLRNNTTDHVTTWVSIAVSIFDTDGVEQEYTAETTIWIDPLGEAEFRVELPDVEPTIFDDLEFCDHDELMPTDCMNWGVTGAMGLSL